MSVKALENIMEEIKKFRLLCRELVEKLILAEEPSEEERKAIEEKDEIVHEKELMEALGKTNV